jgi:hypothetical protein
MKTSLKLSLFILWLIVGTFFLWGAWTYFWEMRDKDIFFLCPDFLMTAVNNLLRGMAYENIVFIGSGLIAFIYVFVLTIVVYGLFSLFRARRKHQK